MSALRSLLAILLAVLTPAAVLAQEAKGSLDAKVVQEAKASPDPEAGQHEVGRELGAVLAWRLTPEIVESHCREPDPAGVEARQKALQGWLDKNAPLIKSVDERVAEVAPLALQTKEGVDPVWVIHRQMGSILKESLFAEKKAEEITALCKAEADPAAPRWNNNGMPHIPNALAALHDWKVQHTAR